MHRKISALAALSVLAIGLAFVVGASHAQYPPPGGGVSIESSDTTTDPGDNVLLTCEVFEGDGSPVPNVGCTMTIVSQPGNTASVGSISVTKLTNSQGIATTNLFVGTTPGIIIVEAEANGFVSSVIVAVEGESASPPQSPISNIQPPSTGSGGLAH